MPGSTDTGNFDPLLTLRQEQREDYRDLRHKNDTIVCKVDRISGQLDVTLPLLARKTDIDASLAKHVADCKYRSISIVPSSKFDKRVFAGLIGAVTVFVFAASKLLEKLIDIL
jgi:hypothetical protein